MKKISWTMDYNSHSDVKKRSDESSLLIRRLPISVRRALKTIAAREGTTMQAIVIGLIEDFVRHRE